MRISVVGTSGSGKSTLASQLAAQLNIEYIEQDELFWLKDWTVRPKEEFSALLEPKLNKNSWTICGNHSAHQEKVFESATHIIWLDYKLPLIYYRAFKRTCGRVFFKKPCCNGNIETFRHAFFSKDSIFFWIHKTYKKRKKMYSKLFEEKKYTNAQYLHFKAPSEVKIWMRSLS